MTPTELTAKIVQRLGMIPSPWGNHSIGKRPPAELALADALQCCAAAFGRRRRRTAGTGDMAARAPAPALPKASRAVARQIGSTGSTKHRSSDWLGSRRSFPGLPHRVPIWSVSSRNPAENTTHYFYLCIHVPSGWGAGGSAECRFDSASHRTDNCLRGRHSENDRPRGRNRRLRDYRPSRVWR
jgi:hypothetical protein